MAAAIKALNAKIRSNKVTDYFFSTHFWGPASNFGIPIAAIADAQKDPSIISGPMTASLTVYSATFMRFALAVQPKNYLLFACHFINFGSQLTQGTRWLKYHGYLGSEAVLASTAKSDAGKIKEDVKEQAKWLKDEARTKAGEVKEKLTK